MAVSKEETISELFVQVELKLDSIIQMCEDAEKSYESAEWDKERRFTLQKFDEMVMTAEGHNEAAKDCLIRHLKACLFRVRFAYKLAVFGIFIIFDGPGKLFPIPGFVLRLLKGRVYEKLLEMPVLMSREIVFFIRDKRRRRLTDEQLQRNRDTQELFKACINELYFVIKAQPFPFTRVLRFADVLMENDRKIMEMLDKRHLITADVFENDQIVFGRMIEDWQREIGVQYCELYKFMLSVEETHAFEGFRSMFGLEDVVEGKTDAERHEENFVNRKYVWLNGPPGPCWIYQGLQFYNNFQYVQNAYKMKIMARYGPE